MFQFTTTTVINSQYAVDYNGNILVDNAGNNVPKFQVLNGAFVVAKVGTFKKDKVKAVYKKAYTAGVKETATLKVPTATLGDVLRLTVVVELDGGTQSDYANYYTEFKQPVTVEVTATGTANTDAANLTAALNKIKTYFGRSIITATVTTDTITLKAKENEQRFKSIKLEKIGAIPSTAVMPAITLLASGTVTVAGKNGFGDDQWMVKSIRIPTYGNNRAFGINKEETPILGGNYSQYTLHYEVPSQQSFVYYGGLSSQTTHVFYVLSSLVSAFEAALTGAGIAPDTIGTAVTGVTVTSGNLDLSNYADDGYQLTYTTTPSGVTGAVWERDTSADVDAASSDADFTKVTVSPTGEVTLDTGHNLADGDTLGFKVTIDGSTFAKTVSVVA